MTWNEVKDKLEEARKSKRKYDTVRRELEEIETMIQSITVDYSKPRVQGSKDTDVSQMIDKLSLTREKCIAELGVYVTNMTTAKNLIDKVQNDKGREVLSRRYILCQKWEDIAEDMPIDFSYAFDVHNKAIKEIVNRDGVL